MEQVIAKAKEVMAAVDAWVNAATVKERELADARKEIDTRQAALTDTLETILSQKDSLQKLLSENRTLGSAQEQLQSALAKQAEAAELLSQAEAKELEADKKLKAAADVEKDTLATRERLRAEVVALEERKKTYREDVIKAMTRAEV